MLLAICQSPGLSPQEHNVSDYWVNFNTVWHSGCSAISCCTVSMFGWQPSCWQPPARRWIGSGLAEGVGSEQWILEVAGCWILWSSIFLQSLISPLPESEHHSLLYIIDETMYWVLSFCSFSIHAFYWWISASLGYLPLP